MTEDLDPDAIYVSPPRRTYTGIALEKWRGDWILTISRPGLTAEYAVPAFVAAQIAEDHLEEHEE